MTTVAYKDGVISYDSRLTNNDTIISDKHDKLIVKNDIMFILVGYSCDLEDLLNAYLGKPYTKDPKHLSSSNLIAIENTRDVFCFSVAPSGENIKIKVRETRAWGTGGRFALGAMDSGKSAQESIAIAANRDVFTGGDIRIIRLE